jgi:hypothetical protein
MLEPDLVARIVLIEARNQRVTIDKAWETSWTRRGVIAGLTYASVALLLAALNHPHVFTHSFIPVAGYLLSTLSLPFIKQVWSRRCQAHKTGAC